MALSLGDIVVNIKSDTSHLAKGFNRAESTVTKASKTMATAVKTLTAAYIGLNAIDLVGNLVKQADTMTLINTRLKLATKSTEELIKAQKELFNISQKARVGFSSTVDLFERITRSTRDYSTSQKEVLGLSETINKAMVISGGTATSMNAAIIQLGQAFSADFQAVGQELASIREQAPRLYQALLEGTNLSSKAFKKHAEDGKLSTQIIIKALQSQSESVATEFKKVNLTVDQSQVQFKNSSLKIVGSIDKIIGASSFIAESISDISKSIDSLTPEDIDKFMDLSENIAIVGGSLVTANIALSTYNIVSKSVIDSNILMSGTFGAVNRAIILATISTRALTIATNAIPFVALSTIAFTAYKVIEASHDTMTMAERDMNNFAKSIDNVNESTLKLELTQLEKALEDVRKLANAEARKTQIGSFSPHYEVLANQLTDYAKKIDIVTEKIKLLNSPVITVSKTPKKGIVPDAADDLSDQFGAIDEEFANIDKLNEAYDDLQEKLQNTFETYNAIVGSDYDVWLQNTNNQLIALAESGSLTAEQLQKVFDLSSSDFQISEALKSTTFDELNDSMLSIFDTFEDIWNTDQMDNFFDSWNKGISGVTKEQNKSNTSLEDVQGLYKTTSSLLGNFYDEDDKRKKQQQQLNQAIQIAQQVQNVAFMVAEFAKAQAAGATAVAIAAQSSPWTGFATATAMIGLLGSVGIMLGGGGGSGGGGGTPPQTIDIETERGNIELASAPIVDELERQTSLLESIDLQGSAGAINVELAKSTYERAYKDWAVDALEVSASTFATKWTTDYTELADVANALNEITGLPVWQAEQWRGGEAMRLNERLLIEGDNLLNVMLAMQEIGSSAFFGISDLGKLGMQTSIEQASEIGFDNIFNELQNVINDWALDVIDIIGTMSESGDDFKQFFDNITGDMHYENARLKQAYEDVDRLRGEESFGDFLQSEIENIPKLVEFLTPQTLELLRGTDPTKINEQIAKIEELSNITKMSFNEGAEGALNYLESIGLVADAMAEITEQRKDFENILARIGASDAEILAMDRIEELSEVTDDYNRSLLEEIHAKQDAIKASNDYEEELRTTLQETLNSVSLEISTLDGVLNSLSGVINKLKDSAFGSGFSLQRFNTSMSETLALSASGDSAAFEKSLRTTIGASDILFNQDAFETARDMQFAQAIAINQLEGIEVDTLEQIDYLRLIEENTREQLEAYQEVSEAQQIANIFEEFLGRAPTAAGLEYYLGDIAGGASIEDIAANVAASPEAAVRASFQETLGRTPETQEGLDYWTGQVESGEIAREALSQAVIIGAVASGELSREAGINALFEGGFGRIPSDAGLAYWTASNIPMSMMPEALAAGAVDETYTPFADGGLVKGGRGGTLGLIGEKNYDELVLPLKDSNDPLNFNTMTKKMDELIAEVTQLRVQNNVGNAQIEKNTKQTRFAN